MTPQQFWQQLPELHILTQIAATLGIQFRLRGSLARKLVAVRPPDHDVEVSMFDFVPPLADIDLVVPSVQAANDVRTLIRAHIPQSRFFHWEIRTPADIARYAGLAYVKIDGQPEIAFGSAKGDTSLPALRCTYSPDDDFSVAMNEQQIHRQPDLTWNTQRARLEKVPSLDPVIDLLYLARHYPGLLDHPTAGRLHDRAVRAVKPLALLVPHSAMYERLVLAILKFLYRDDSPHPIPTWFRALCGHLALASKDAQLKQLFTLSLRVQSDEPIATIVRPENQGGNWIRRLHRLQPLQSHDAWRLRSKALSVKLASDAPPPLRLSPITMLSVDPAPDPACCRYEDFSSGTVDIVWQDHQGPKWPVSSSLVLVDLSAEEDSITGSVSDDDLGLAHAYVTFGQVGTIRTDYSFLSILAGKRRPVKILAVSNR